MKKQIALALALAAAPLFAASAGELSYSYIEAGYARADMDLDGTDVDFDGFAARGSVELGTAFYLFGGYSSGSNDDFGFDVDLNQGQIGLGYHHGLTDRADLIAELSFVDVEAEALGFSESENGYRASVGFRGELAENFEGLVKGNYTDAGDDSDGDFSATVGAQFKFNPTWGLVGEIELGDDVTQYLLGVRASF